LTQLVRSVLSRDIQLSLVIINLILDTMIQLLYHPHRHHHSIRHLLLSHLLPPSTVSGSSSALTPTQVWFLNSYVLTHVTYNINNLSYSQPYQGHDTVHIDNDSSLPIIHTGTTFIYTDIAPLKLTNTLHISLISLVCPN
jgi:hypothetical protein